LLVLLLPLDQSVLALFRLFVCALRLLLEPLLVRWQLYSLTKFYF
jgi:hypothetical protein